MNKLHYLVLMLFLLAFSGCKKDRAQPIDLTYQLAVDPEVISFQVPFEKAEAILTSKTSNEQYTAQPNAQGLLTFQTVTPGTYSINVSLTLTAEEVSELSGVYTDEDIQLNFSADNQYYDFSTSTGITLISSRALGNWVFKQIYYAGSDTRDGAVFRDAFVEIYNNSSEVLYADSLVFVVAYGKTNNNAGEYLLSNLQYDWSQAINMTRSGDANEDYIYAKALFMIPSNGAGTRFPVEPGKSFIIASTAIDHTKPYTLNSDRIQDIGDPTLTVNLENADFEVYLYPYEQQIQPGRTKFASDIDNPSVTDVETIFATSMRDLILVAQGRDSYALVKFDGSVDLHNLPAYAVPTTRTVTDATTLYPQIPAHYILDAVEVGAPIESDRIPRRLPLYLDAGVGHVNAGPYSSESIVRKTKQIVNGRRILQDTNNSTQDFGVKTKADPSKSASSFID